MQNLTQSWTQSGPSFPKSGHFFGFSKRARDVSLVPFSCTPVCLAEYASPNIPEYA